MLLAKFPKLFFFSQPEGKKTEKYAPTYLSEQRTVAIVCFSRKKKKLYPFAPIALFQNIAVSLFKRRGWGWGFFSQLASAQNLKKKNPPPWEFSRETPVDIYPLQMPLRVDPSPHNFNLLHHTLLLRRQM